MDNKSLLPFPAEPGLLELIETHALLKEIPAGTVLLREGSFVATVPIVLEGLLKVDRVDEERELLLYYIQPGQSCIMSFSAIFRTASSKVVAVAEEDSQVLLLPGEFLSQWHQQFPSLQQYYLNLYQQYYDGLLSTIDVLAFQRMDARILAYLRKKAEAKGTTHLSMTHQQIAQEVGSTREVVSRILKKLETEGMVTLGRNEIEVRMNQTPEGFIG